MLSTRQNEKSKQLAGASSRFLQDSRREEKRAAIFSRRRASKRDERRLPAEA